MQRHIFDTIAGVIQAREQAGAVALLILVWVALQCFTTLICATNRAWGTRGIQLVAAAAEEPGAARHHGGCGPPGHGGAGADENGEGLAVSRA